MSKKKKGRFGEIKPHWSIYGHYMILMLISVSLVIPSDSEILPFFIYLAMLVVALMIIHPNGMAIVNEILLSRVKRKRKRIDKYSISILCIYIACLLVVVFTFIFERAKFCDYSISVLISSVVMMVASMYYYISNSSVLLDNVSGSILWSFRIIMIAISYLVLLVAKNMAADYMDVTYDIVSNQTVLYAFFIIILIFLSYLFSGFVYLIIVVFEGGPAGYRQGRRRHVKYAAMPIALPVALLMAIIPFCFFMHWAAVESSILRQSIEWGSSTRFYCGGGYKTFGNDQYVRFIKISDNDYRAFVFSGHKIHPYRLTCSDSYPYYKTNYILSNSADIRTQMKLDEINSDLKNSIHSKG